MNDPIIAMALKLDLKADQIEKAKSYFIKIKDSILNSSQPCLIAVCLNLVSEASKHPDILKLSSSDPKKFQSALNEARIILDLKTENQLNQILVKEGYSHLLDRTQSILDLFIKRYKEHNSNIDLKRHEELFINVSVSILLDLAPLFKSKHDKGQFNKLSESFKSLCKKEISDFKANSKKKNSKFYSNKIVDDSEVVADSEDETKKRTWTQIQQENEKVSLDNRVLYGSNSMAKRNRAEKLAKYKIWETIMIEKVMSLLNAQEKIELGLD